MRYVVSLLAIGLLIAVTGCVPLIDDGGSRVSLYDDFTDSSTQSDKWILATPRTDVSYQNEALFLTKNDTGGTTARIESKEVIQGDQYTIEARCLGMHLVNDGGKTGELMLTLKTAGDTGEYIRICVVTNGQVKGQKIHPKVGAAQPSQQSVFNKGVGFTNYNMPHILKIVRNGNEFTLYFDDEEMGKTEIEGFSTECRVALETYLNLGEGSATSYWDWVKIIQ